MLPFMGVIDQSSPPQVIDGRSTVSTGHILHCLVTIPHETPLYFGVIEL